MSETTEGEQAALIDMSTQQFVRVILIGAVIGVVTWGLTLLLDSYIFQGIVCKGSASAQCTSSFEYAGISASILAGGLGLLGLVRTRVFRALLIVIAAMVSLWGVSALLKQWDWPIAVPVSAVFYAVAYGLYAWIARIRSFIMTLVIIVILIVAIRFVMNL